MTEYEAVLSHLRVAKAALAHALRDMPADCDRDSKMRVIVSDQQVEQAIIEFQSASSSAK